MTSSLIRSAVRTRFTCTTRAQANRLIREEARATVNLAESFSEAEGQRSVRVPRMLGVDEEMRDWSVFQLLEHNVIVNRIITITMLRLAAGKKVPELGDPKRDVLPTENPGPEQVATFRKSVDDHLDRVEGLDRLRGVGCHPHPLFGPFDAHQWNCMFGFHLKIHRLQLEAIRKGSIEGEGRL